MTDELLSRDDARKALGGIGNTKLYALLASGRLQGVKIGSRLMFKRSEISRYISELPAFKSEAAHGA